MIITQVKSNHILILLKLAIQIKEIVEEGQKIVAEVMDRKLRIGASSALNKDTE